MRLQPVPVGQPGLLTAVGSNPTLAGAFYYFRDPWNLFEALYVCFQLAVNILFLTHQHIQDAVWRVGVVDAYNLTQIQIMGSEQRRMLRTSGLANLESD